MAFAVLCPVLIFLLLPLLKFVLGPASEEVASEVRVSMWMELAKLFA
jgi:hypothetical protein